MEREETQCYILLHSVLGIICGIVCNVFVEMSGCENERGDISNAVSDKNTLQIDCWKSLCYSNLVPVDYLACKDW